MPLPSALHPANETIARLLAQLTGTGANAHKRNHAGGAAPAAATSGPGSNGNHHGNNSSASGDTAGEHADLLRLLIENTPDHLHVLSVDGEIVYSNSAPAGPQSRATVGRHIEDCVHPADVPAVRAALTRCVRSGETVEYEVALSPHLAAAQLSPSHLSPPRPPEHSLATNRWGSARLVPICSQGEVQCVILYGRDITAQRNDAERLRASQQRLAMVFQATPLAALIVDSSLCVREWNPAAENLFGYSRDEALGQPLIELIIPEQHRGAVRERFVSAFSGRYGFGRSRNINQTRRGELITCKWFNTPLYDGQGNIEAMAALGQDISEQLRAEQALAEAMRAAEASTRAKSQFLANMSHEIRTPMHGVLGASELLLRQSLTDEVRSDMELIHQSATSLLAIVDDILDFSKLEADTVHLHTCAVDVADLLHDTVELLRPLADNKQIQYTFSQHGGGACVAVIDPVRVRQVINNLVGNAIKFTERGFVHIEQHWSQRGAFTHLQVIVRDTGPGIAPEQTQVIFDDFYQADGSWTRSYGGTGLGLAISRRLAELMGGTISVDSEPGQGSRFTFDLCAKSAQPFPAVADAEPGRQQFRATVLLVDDNPVNLAVGEKLLRYVGLTVHTARDGHRALQMAHHRLYDVIFMDIQMPDLDGLATCRQLRAEGCTAPIIAVTADALPEDRERCMEAGMQAILTKPFRTVDIAIALQPHLPPAPPPGGKVL